MKTLNFYKLNSMSEPTPEYAIQQINSHGEIPSQLADVSRLFRKVKITLSDSQFKALFHLIAFWLNKAPAKGELFEMAYYLAVHKLFNSKLQKAVFNLRSNVTISLDICQANTLMEALSDYQLNNSSYEMMTIRHIIQEIDKQTV